MFWRCTFHFLKRFLALWGKHDKAQLFVWIYSPCISFAERRDGSQCWQSALHSTFVTQCRASVSVAVIRRQLHGTCPCAPWLCSCLYSLRCSYCCCSSSSSSNSSSSSSSSSSCFCSYSSSCFVVLFFLLLFLERKGKAQIFRKVAPCLWVSSYRRFEYKVTMILWNVEECLPNDTA
jgi:hypothetical protein